MSKDFGMQVARVWKQDGTEKKQGNEERKHDSGSLHATALQIQQIQ